PGAILRGSGCAQACGPAQQKRCTGPIPLACLVFLLSISFVTAALLSSDISGLLGLVWQRPASGVSRPRPQWLLDDAALPTCRHPLLRRPPVYNRRLLRTQPVAREAGCAVPGVP